MCIGTASIARSTIATAEAIFWRAIVASAIKVRTTSLDTRSKGRPGNVAPTKSECVQRSTRRTSQGHQKAWLSIWRRVMPRDGAIIFSDLIGKLDASRIAVDTFACVATGSALLPVASIFSLRGRVVLVNTRSGY